MISFGLANWDTRTDGGFTLAGANSVISYSKSEVSVMLT